MNGKMVETGAHFTDFVTVDGWKLENRNFREQVPDFFHRWQPRP